MSLAQWYETISKAPASAPAGAYVQGTTANGMGGPPYTMTCTLTGVTAGNLIIVGTCFYMTRTNSITDSQSNTWYEICSTNTGFNVGPTSSHIDMWWCYAKTSGTLTVTLTASGSSPNSCIAMAEYSGYSGGLDQKLEGVSGTSVTSLATTLFTNATNDLLLSWGLTGTGTAPSNYTSPGVLRLTTTLTGEPGGYGDQAGASTAAGTNTLTTNFAGSSSPGYVAASFKRTGSPLIPAYNQTGLHTNASWASPETITLTTPTTANDCIVVAYALTGTSITPVFAGLGAAAWTNYSAATTSPSAGLAVGYNCAAGQTSFTVTGVSASAGDIVWAVLRNVRSASNPVVGQITNTAAAANSLSANCNVPAIGDVYIQGFMSSIAAVTWSQPAVTYSIPWTIVPQSNTNLAVALFFQLAGGTGIIGCGSTMSSGTGNLRASGVALNPAP
jgi:hypothetical protein